MLFCTAHLTAQQKLRFTGHCLDQLQAEFVPQDIEALRSLLDSVLQAIREKYLLIKESHLGVAEMAKLKGLKWELERIRDQTANALSAYPTMFRLDVLEGLIIQLTTPLEDRLQLQVEVDEIRKYCAYANDAIQQQRLTGSGLSHLANATSMAGLSNQVRYNCQQAISHLEKLLAPPNDPC